MSMISILIDDLRQMADGQATYRDARVVMLQAADTIWELRDDLQQENAENALLREHITTQKQTIQSYRDESREWREVAERAQAENAELRELAVRAYKTARMMCEAWDGPCRSNSDVPSWRVPCPTDERDERCVFGQLERDMRELGVEI